MTLREHNELNFFHLFFPLLSSGQVNEQANLSFGSSNSSQKLSRELYKRIPL